MNKKDEKKDEKEKQKQKQKVKRHKDVSPTSSSVDQMEKKARLAERVIAGLENLDSNDEDNSRKKLGKVILQNPPVVISTDRLGIETCQGCGNGITKDQQMYPSIMVFR